MKISSAKLAFASSLLVIAFLLGYSARQNGFFPDSIIRTVQQKASDIWYRPILTTRTYDREGVQQKQPEKIQPGLTFINALWNDPEGPRPGFNLVDRNGKVIHKWRVDRDTLFPDSVDLRGNPNQASLHGSYLFPNGDVVFNSQYIGTVRINACSEVLWHLPKGGHHSIARADDGSFWVSGTSDEMRTSTEQYPNGFPGLDNPLWLDQIHHVSADGKLLERINVLDILYQNDLQRYIAKAYQPQAGDEQPRTTDILHLNDVEPLPPSMADEYPLFEAGDLVASLRKIDLVFVFDPDTGGVKWHTSDPIIMQHDPDFIGDGWIGIYDNNRNFGERGRMLEGSRVVAVQPHTDSVEIRFPTSKSEPFYADTQGKWQQLPNGNMLLVEAKAGRVVEVAPDGSTVWEWIIDPYSESKVSRILTAIRHDLTPEDVASWSCSTAAGSSR
jgi:hypothetical protein